MLAHGKFFFQILCVREVVDVMFFGDLQPGFEKAKDQLWIKLLQRMPPRLDTS